MNPAIVQNRPGGDHVFHSCICKDDILETQD